MQFREKLTIFLLFFLIFSFFSSFKTTVQIPDEEYVLKVAQNIAEGKDLSLPDRFPYVHPGVTELGKDGKKYSTYPIGQSLIYAPFYLVFKKVNIFLSPFKGPDTKKARISWLNRIEFETTRYFYIVPALFSALSCLIFYLFCFALGNKRITCFASTLIFGLATIVWPYSKLLLSEATQSFFLIYAVYLLYIQVSKKEYKPFPTAMAGISFGMLCIIKPIFIILLPLLAFYWLYKNFDNKTALVSSAIFLGLFLFIFSFQMMYNSIRFSEASNFGYTHSRFTAPFYVGLYGMLFSSGKSFFLYSPVTILFFFSIKNFFKRSKREALLFSGIIVSIICICSSWNVWSGDFSWGPRFLVPLVSLFMLPACHIIEKGLILKKKILRGSLILLVLVSLWVQIPAVGVHFLTYLNYFKLFVAPIPAANMKVNFKGIEGKMHLRDPNQDFQFIPEFSPVLGQWWVFKHLIFNSEESFKNTPWKGLGYNKFHEKVPLRAKFDLWTVNLLKNSLKSGNLANLFWIFTILGLIPIVVTFYFFDPKVSKRMHFSLSDVR